MMISALEKATAADRDAIVAIVESATCHLNQTGIQQWDEVYPNAANVDADMRKQQLYVARADGSIAGIITLNQECDPDYKNGAWLYQGSDFMVVHRLIVAPAMQGQGIGAQIMRLAETMLKERGIKSVRLDAFAHNPHSLRLYEKLGYRIVGEADWRKGHFYLMEKLIGTNDVRGPFPKKEQV